MNTLEKLSFFKTWFYNKEFNLPLGCSIYVQEQEHCSFLWTIPCREYRAVVRFMKKQKHHLYLRFMFKLKTKLNSLSTLPIEETFIILYKNKAPLTITLLVSAHKLELLIENNSPYNKRNRQEY